LTLCYAGTDRTDEYGEHVDGYVVSKNQVRKEQEDHSDDPIDDELPQITPASRQEEQDYYYHQYEYDEFHHPSVYTTCCARTDTQYPVRTPPTRGGVQELRPASITKGPAVLTSMCVQAGSSRCLIR
jgi:hypothetical protein